MDLDSIIHIPFDSENFQTIVCESLWYEVPTGPHKIWYERTIQISAQLPCLVVCKYYDMCVIITMMGAPMGLVAILIERIQ